MNPALPAFPTLRLITVSAMLALIVLCVGWELAWAPLRPGGSWLVLKALPLCIPLAGLLKNRLYTYRWLSLMVWLYFIEGTVRATSDLGPSRWFALAEVVLCVVIFAACAVYVRSRLRNAPAA